MTFMVNLPSANHENAESVSTQQGTSAKFVPKRGRFGGGVVFDEKPFHPPGKPARVAMAGSPSVELGFGPK
jgi:hypothetical protein